MSEPSEHKTLFAALLALQAELPKAIKTETAKVETKTGRGYSYKYASLADLIELVRPLLVEHGLVWSTFPTRDAVGEPALRYRLTHAASSEAEQDVMPLMLASRDPQAQGSAITYARRYALVAVLDLIVDDDDAQAAQPKPQQQKLQAAPNGALHPESRRELAVLATGMTTGQIKLALTAVGIEHPTMGADIFSTVPQTKAALLAEALATAKAGA